MFSLSSFSLRRSNVFPSVKTPSENVTYGMYVVEFLNSEKSLRYTSRNGVFVVVFLYSLRLYRRITMSTLVTVCLNQDGKQSSPSHGLVYVLICLIIHGPNILTDSRVY